MTINDFLNMYNVKCEGWEGNIVRPRVKCADGYTVSVQAGYGVYSIPGRFSYYFSAVELGYPSAADEELIEYAENKDDLTDSVYGYVPVELVDYIMNKHGGIIGADYSNDHNGDWSKDGN